MSVVSISEALGCGRIRDIKSGSMYIPEQNILGIGDKVWRLSPVVDPHCRAGCVYCSVKLRNPVEARYLAEKNIAVVARIINRKKPDALWVMERTEVGLNKRAMKMLIEFRRLIDPSIMFILSTKFPHNIYKQLKGNYLLLTSLSNPTHIPGLEKRVLPIEKRIYWTNKAHKYGSKYGLKTGYRLLFGQRKDIVPYRKIFNQIPKESVVIADFMRSDFYKTDKYALRDRISPFLSVEEYEYVSSKKSTTGESLKRSIIEEAIRMIEEVRPDTILDRLSPDNTDAIKPKLTLIPGLSPTECYLIPGMLCVGKACLTKKRTDCKGLIKDGAICPGLGNVPHDLYHSAVGLWLNLLARCRHVDGDRSKQPFPGRKRIERVLYVLLHRMDYMSYIKREIGILKLTFHGNKKAWKRGGGIPNTAKLKIIGVLKDVPYGLHSSEIAKRTRLNMNQVNMALHRMVKAHQAKRVGLAVYTLTTNCIFTITGEIMK